jgi:hypothetical protein
MDNQKTIDASVASARENLMSSIGNKTDWGSYKDTSAPATSSATDNATLNTESEDRGASEVTESSNNQTNEVPSREENTTKIQSETVANPTDTGNPINKTKSSRENERIRQLNEKAKASEARALAAEKQLQERNQTQVKADSKPQEPKAFVPKPALSKEYLQAEYSKYEQAEADAIIAGDKNALLQARNYQKAITKLLKEHDEWEPKNNAEIQKRNGETQYYRTEALKKFESLKDPASPLTQEYAGIRGWVNQQLPALLDEPVTEYFLAQIADWKLSSGRLATVEADYKKAREEIEKLKKGSLPLTTNSKPELGGNDSPDASVKDAKKGLMDSIRNANLGMTM